MNIIKRRVNLTLPPEIIDDAYECTYNSMYYAKQFGDRLTLYPKVIWKEKDDGHKNKPRHV